MDEVQDGIERAAGVLASAVLVVRAVGSKRFSRRLLQKNQATLNAQAMVLREVAEVLERLSNELPRDYR